MQDEQAEPIDLFDIPIGIIRANPSGKTYTNQAGGYACEHPELTGELLPWPNETAKYYSDFLLSYFMGPKWKGWCHQGIDEETAKVIDAVLDCLTPDAWEVDRARLADSMEAWVWIVDKAHSTGVLFWENGD